MFRRIPKRNRTGVRTPYSICCRPVLRPAAVVCLLDNLLHRLHFDVNPICDLHDRLITGDWIDDEHLSPRHRLRRFLRLEPVETGGPPTTSSFTGDGSIWVTPSNTATGGTGSMTVYYNPPDAG